MSKSGVMTPRPPQPDVPRGGPARALADLLPDVGGAAFRRFGFIQSSVVGRWAEIVGPRYAAVSQPESIRFPRGKREDGVLTLVVRGAHGPMMQHVSPEIIERVNRFFGYPAVARIVFRQGTLAAPAPRKGVLLEALQSIAQGALSSALGAFIVSAAPKLPGLLQTALSLLR